MFSNTYGTAALAGAFSKWVALNVAMCAKQGAAGRWEEARVAFAYCRAPEFSAEYEGKLTRLGRLGIVVRDANLAYSAALDAFKALPADLQMAAEDREQRGGFLFRAA